MDMNKLNLKNGTEDECNEDENTKMDVWSDWIW